MNNTATAFAALNPIQAGDKLSFDQRMPPVQATGNGGIGIWANGVGYNIDDAEGQPNWDSTVTDGLWHHRSFDLGSTLAGQSMTNLEIDMQNSTGAGAWEIDYANIVFRLYQLATKRGIAAMTRLYGGRSTHNFGHPIHRAFAMSGWVFTPQASMMAGIGTTSAAGETPKPTYTLWWLYPFRFETLQANTSLP